MPHKISVLHHLVIWHYELPCVSYPFHKYSRSQPRLDKSGQTLHLLSRSHQYPYNVLIETFEYKKHATPLVKYKQLNPVLISMLTQMFSIEVYEEQKLTLTLKTWGNLADVGRFKSNFYTKKIHTKTLKHLIFQFNSSLYP